MATPFLTRKQLLLIKPEGVYGTDAVPTAQANTVLVSDLKIKPDWDIIDNDKVALPSLSSIPHQMGKSWVQIDFSFDLHGSGGSGATPPDFGAFFRACSMLEIIEPDPEGYVLYNLISENQESVTMYGWKDRQLHKAVGVVGSWKMAGEVGKKVTFSATAKGKLLEIVDLNMPVPVFQNLRHPLLLGATFSYGGWSAPIKKFEIDLKNKISERTDHAEATGISGFWISNREIPQGKVDPEANTLATRNIWGNLQSGNEGSLELIFGNSPGNKVTITAPRCVKRSVDWGDREGIATYDMTFGLYQSSDNGDDELLMKFE